MLSWVTRVSTMAAPSTDVEPMLDNVVLLNEAREPIG